MSTEQEQIRVCYEQLGMLPEEIALDRELDVVAVKAALMSCSVKYRKDCGAVMDTPQQDVLNFTDEQLQRVNDKIYQIAVGSENDAVALKAAMYIRDDKKGRLDAVRAIACTTFNILDFNEELKKASAVVDAALGVKKAIDV